MEEVEGVAADQSALSTYGSVPGAGVVQQWDPWQEDPGWASESLLGWPVHADAGPLPRAVGAVSVALLCARPRHDTTCGSSVTSCHLIPFFDALLALAQHSTAPVHPGYPGVERSVFTSTEYQSTADTVAAITHVLKWLWLAVAIERGHVRTHVRRNRTAGTQGVCGD